MALMGVVKNFQGHGDMSRVSWPLRGNDFSSKGLLVVYRLILTDS